MTPPRDSRPWMALSLCLLATFAAKAFIALGIPIWGWDERRYLAAAWGFTTDTVPPMPLRNALYPFLLQPAFLLGDGFHAGVKVINAALVSTAMLPVFCLARDYLRPSLALSVAVVSAWLGQNTIASHAMTEALIFPVFCAVMWALVRVTRRLSAPAAALAGASAWLGVAMSVLSHATPKHRPAWLAVAGSLLLTAALDPPQPGPNTQPAYARLAGDEGRPAAARSRWRRVALSAGSVGVAWVATVTLLNLVVHGRMLGTPADRYDGVMGLIVSDFVVSLRVHATEVRDMVVAHAATLGGLLGAAVALCLAGLVRAARARDTERLALLAPVVIAAAAYVLVSIVVAVSIDGGNERITFARYYYFTYPGLLIGAVVVARDASARRAEAVWMTLVILVSLAAAAFTFGSGVSTASPHAGIIENADYWHLRFPRLYPWVLLGSGCALVAAAFRWRRWLPHVLLIQVAGYSLISNVSQAQYNGFGRSTLTACYALRQLHPLPEAQVGLVSDSRHTAEVSAFFPPFTLRPRILTAPQVRRQDVPPGVQYVFVEGALSVTADNLEPVAKVEGCSLWRVSRP